LHRVNPSRYGLGRLGPRDRAEWLADLDRTARNALACDPRVLHVIRERDVGLFSLVQQVIAQTAWALTLKRCPVVDFRDRTVYWTPSGHRGAESVWEYYFEPVLATLPSSVVPTATTELIDQHYPKAAELGFFAAPTTYVSTHYGDHSILRGVAPLIPCRTGNPGRPLREWTSAIIARFVRPRPYILDKVDRFFAEHMAGAPVIGVHARGTDAVSSRQVFADRSLRLDRYEQQIATLLASEPKARILVATDDQASLDRLSRTFGERVVAYDAIRHVDGDPAGSGPTGELMPAYIATDPYIAAQNGEDAVVEYMLLRRCRHLVHNGASIATTVLLGDPEMPHTNTHRPSSRLDRLLRRSGFARPTSLRR
jgi:hypothetical protein